MLDAAFTDAHPIGCRLVCWCGSILDKWVLGNLFCGRACRNSEEGHKLQIARMECAYCRCQRPIVLPGAAPPGLAGLLKHLLVEHGLVAAQLQGPSLT